MNKETREASEGEMNYSYAGYVACGGRIDELTYHRAMKQVRETSHLDSAEDFAVSQTKITADISGVSLDAARDNDGIDPRVLYGILRRDVGSAGAAHHHSQMSDQQLLVESLRMLEQNDAVQAIIAKHPHINFN